MPFVFSNPLPSFYACPNKQKARLDTIIDKYKALFGNKIPKTQQYWTMCSMQTDSDGVFQNGSELGQLLKSGILQENQFHGVDIEANYINDNKKAKPKANWHHNDFVNQMRLAHSEKWFNPAIVYADLLNLKGRAVPKAAEIMYLLTAKGISNVMLVVNIMLNNPHAREQISDEKVKTEANAIVKLFEKNRTFRAAWNKGKWDAGQQYYVYGGTGKRSNTKMITFIFYRK